ncbi:hypothetical protein GDO81_002741 [Engystomops pustulosus]|uniref:Uncharacterized protein n=1 Tax=Engystomops pustulosus TaxID=76066 RepID=A0AAV7DMM8_ENGPU|nr:hypothetical protein GDO81_002741 [Engystomops pustulosus]
MPPSTLAHHLHLILLRYTPAIVHQLPYSQPLPIYISSCCPPPTSYCSLIPPGHAHHQPSHPAALYPGPCPPAPISSCYPVPPIPCPPAPISSCCPVPQPMPSGPDLILLPCLPLPMPPPAPSHLLPVPQPMPSSPHLHTVHCTPTHAFSHDRILLALTSPCPPDPISSATRYTAHALQPPSSHPAALYPGPCPSSPHLILRALLHGPCPQPQYYPDAYTQLCPPAPISSSNLYPAHALQPTLYPAPYYPGPCPPAPILSCCPIPQPMPSSPHLILLPYTPAHALQPPSHPAALYPSPCPPDPILSCAYTRALPSSPPISSCCPIPQPMPSSPHLIRCPIPRPMPSSPISSCCPVPQNHAFGPDQSCLPCTQPMPSAPSHSATLVPAPAFKDPIHPAALYPGHALHDHRLLPAALYPGPCPQAPSQSLYPSMLTHHRCTYPGPALQPHLICWPIHPAHDLQPQSPSCAYTQLMPSSPHLILLPCTPAHVKTTFPLAFPAISPFILLPIPQLHAISPHPSYPYAMPQTLSCCPTPQTTSRAITPPSSPITSC